MPKNLLIGAVTHYIWDDVAPFFNSYLQAGFDNCDCVMFTGNMSEQTLEKIRACGVTVHPIPDQLMNISIINCRWKIYADYLNSHKGKYDLVFTADLRDVFFQGDVFRYYGHSESFLGVALEDSSLTQNRDWIINAYGQALYEDIKDERIICVGTIWGTPDKFTEFAEVMWEKLSSEWASSRNVIEQAVGNFLIYHDKMFADVLRPSTNQDGTVMTIGLTDAKDIHTDSAGNVLNGKGEIAAVVHQYDRKPKIIDIVLKKYGADMSAFSKLNLKHFQDFFGRILRFLSRVNRRGLIRSVREAIGRRIHRC